MAEPSQHPLAAGSGRRPPGGTRSGTSRPALAAALTLAVVIAGTAVLGAAIGFLWATLAPRALAVVVGHGSANVVNPETSAFIAADGWFALLTVGGGVVSGLLGYALAVRRHGALAMAGVLAGALAATLIAMWIGQRSGTGAFNHGLAIGRPGTLLHVPLTLGGRGPLAFWPLAAGIAAGGSEAIVLLRERRRRPAPRHAADGSASGGPAFGGPAFGDPAFGDPAFGDPASGGPASGGPAFGDPASGGPASGGPGAGGPASDGPAAPGGRAIAPGEG